MRRKLQQMTGRLTFKNKEVDKETKRRKRGGNKGKDERREETVSVNSICTPPTKCTLGQGLPCKT